MIRRESHRGKEPEAPAGLAEALPAFYWSFGHRLGQALLQILPTAILARLLDPAAYGAMALVLALVRIAQQLTDLGWTSALVQKERLAPEELAALLRGTLWLNGTLALGLLLLAPALPALFPQAGPESGWLLALLALSPLLSGLGQSCLALLRRDLDYRSLAGIQLAALLAGPVGVAIPLALSGWGAWSLAWSHLAQAAVIALAGWRLRPLPWSPAPTWRQAKGWLTLGGGFYLLRGVDALRGAVPPLLIVAALGAAATGRFDRLTLLVFLPLEYFGSAFSQVLFPLFSRWRGDRRAVAEGVLVAHGLMASLLLPLVAGMMVSGPLIIAALLGEGWREAAPMFWGVALWGGVHFLHQTASVALESLGRLAALVRQRIRHLALLLGLLLFVPWNGESQFPLVLAAADLYLLASCLRMAGAALEISWGQWGVVHGPSLLPTLTVGGGLWFTAGLLERAALNPWLALGCQMGAGAALLALSWPLGGGVGLWRRGMTLRHTPPAAPSS
ncbi:MAG: oligosaccharide flippase family protein [Magnetococcales bacterium]|nr:oligosaccharide flippase family protein [Magnetococcales bacterium]